MRNTHQRRETGNTHCPGLVLNPDYGRLEGYNHAGMAVSEGRFLRDIAPSFVGVVHSGRRLPAVWHVTLISGSLPGRFQRVDKSIVVAKDDDALHHGG
jgi:hypothetical protein